ncbi:MAG: hypoxanthine phosphoribosyltransferase [Thermodesulfobacteriota bacterium]|nr:MAG: hypoxanthine phosphoribosyltransferase [Thermodesulfobacteriota bacterium]
MKNTLEPYLTPGEIKSIVRGLAGRIRRDYRGKNPMLVCVLKGAAVFMSDLMRELDMDVEAAFIQSSTYGKRKTPAGEPDISGDITSPVKGRDVIIVEGIVDRGITVKTVMERIGALAPSSIKVCALLLREGPVETQPAVDYAGRTIGEGFVVGYGMDYMEKYREKPGLYFLKA